jgi:CBS domain-containing protein
MICPHCSHDNLPGSEMCARCHLDLTHLDLPVAQDRAHRSLLEDPVSVLNPPTPVTVRPEAPVSEAVGLMLASNIGALLVVGADDRLLGILSERDLMLKVVGLIELSDGRPVRDFMTPNPETVVATDTLAVALCKMDSGGYRHLPVLHQGKPVGMVSVRDMLTHFTQMCNS